MRKGKEYSLKGRKEELNEEDKNIERIGEQFRERKKRRERWEK